LTSEMEKYSNIDTFNEFLDKSTQIHMFIWGSLKNKYFLSTIAGIHDNMLQAYRRAFDIQWTSARSFKTYFKKSMKNHKIIAEKISKRNRTGLKNAIKNHWMALAK